MDYPVSVLHAQLPRAILAITGGGASTLGHLLSIPGASRWLLETIVPYSPSSLAEFLGRVPEQACSAATAEAMARRARDRARWLAPGEPVLGLGATASLASDRPKKGDHRVHVAVAFNDKITCFSLTLAKGQRERAGEESVCSALILHALAAVMGIPGPPLPLQDTENLQVSDLPSILVDQSALLHLTPVGRLETPPQPCGAVPALLPGAFNPLHSGHWAMAQAAATFLKRPVAFELSVANVDKPELGPEEVRRRLDQFAGRAEVWVTRAPRFVEKAQLFPGTTFIVGVDTALRVVDVKYYEGDPARMHSVLAQLQQLGCRFLVACRQMAEKCQTLADVSLPARFADLFLALPPEVFRLDVSSTTLRQRLLKK